MQNTVSTASLLAGFPPDQWPPAAVNEIRVLHNHDDPPKPNAGAKPAKTWHNAHDLEPGPNGGLVRRGPRAVEIKRAKRPGFSNSAKRAKARGR